MYLIMSGNKPILIISYRSRKASHKSSNFKTQILTQYFGIILPP